MGSEKEIVNINFGEVGISLPRSTEAIQTARKLLDMLEEDIEVEEKGISKVHTCKLQGSPQASLTAATQREQIESLPERKDEVIASIPQEQPNFNSELIPKFGYDKKTEKNYNKIFFFETEDGRVMLSYSNCRVYTTKAAVMQIPFPVPYGYVPLKELSTNRKTAVRTYRKYLSEMDAGYPAPPEEKETASQREDELRKKGEINKARWKKPEKEMSAKTEKLRDMVISMGIQ